MATGLISHGVTDEIRNRTMDLRKSFDALGLDPAADANAAKRAYKAMVRRWHPDQFPAGSLSKIQAEERLKQINVAYACVREHLRRAARPPFSGTRTDESSAARSPDRPSADPRAGTRQNAPRRSWFDHLFDRLHAFDAGRAEKGPSKDSGTPNGVHRRKSFEQVLGEMAGGQFTARNAATKQRPAPSTRFRSGAGGPSRRSGASVDAVDGTDRVGPVRPVSRVRGIGKSR